MRRSGKDGPPGAPGGRNRRARNMGAALCLAGLVCALLYWPLYGVSMLRGGAASRKPSSGSYTQFLVGLDFNELHSWVRKHFADNPEEAAQRSSFSSKCDLWSGRWVYDERYPLWSRSNCPLNDTMHHCQAMGRTDFTFTKLRWQPHGCNITRFNAADFRRRMRGRHFLFVGDSMARNQFTSLLCMVWAGVNTTLVSKKPGFHGIIGHDTLSAGFAFVEFKITIEYARSNFLIAPIPAPKDAPENVSALLQVDALDEAWTRRVKDADVVVLSLGHWLNPDKTFKEGIFFAVNGTLRPDIDEVKAFERTMHSLAKWADSLDRTSKQVFFRGYSPTHFMGGDWKTGGKCPDLVPEPNVSRVASLHFTESTKEAIAGMRRPMTFLDIHALSAARRDGHTARGVGRSWFDCSHWCLPGVPDIWNELMYMELLRQGDPPFS